VPDAAAAAGRGSPIATPTTCGRLFYLGSGHAGVLGLVDASEATDTYGSHFNDVRAFTDGGWGTMGVGAGMAGAVAVPPELRRMPLQSAAAGEQRAQPLPSEGADPSLTSFTATFLPTLSRADCVVILHLDEGGVGGAGGPAAPPLNPRVLAAAAAAAAAGAAVHHVCVVRSDDGGAAADAAAADAAAARSRGGVVLRLPRLALGLGAAGGDVAALPPLPAGVAAAAARLAGGDAAVPPPPSLGGLALKLCLNAVTTGGHVGKGAIIGNRMGNMMLTNHKLYLRAVGIVGEVAGVPPGPARAAVLRSIYGVDDAGEVAALEAAEGADPGVVAAHIARASVTEQVIPVALVLALSGAGKGLGGGAEGGTTVADARRALAAHPAVRRAVAAMRAGSVGR
jgi:hypothetical protein